MSEVITTRQAPRRIRKTPMRVICDQVITPEWGRALIRQNMPALVELYKKALEAKRVEAEKAKMDSDQVQCRNDNADGEAA
jgi:hypothetical protein